MAASSAFPAADVNNIKDEDAREMKEDDANNKMLGTNKIGHIGATPAAPTTPILVAREVDQGLQPIAQRDDVAQDCAAN